MMRGKVSRQVESMRVGKSVTLKKKKKNLWENAHFRGRMQNTIERCSDGGGGGGRGGKVEGKGREGDTGAGEVFKK